MKDELNTCQVLLRLEASLLEGLHWDDARSCLWMVNIHGQRIINWQPGVGSHEWSTDQRVGWVIPSTQTDELIAGFQQGIARIELPDPSRDTIVVRQWLIRPFDHQPALRLNDAKADASGAIWAGSLNNDDESRSDGSLFRLGPDGQWSVQDAGYKVANGPAIHPDGQWMLHTDSARQTIYAFDLDVAAGRLEGKRVWRTFSPEEGYPDGMTFDAEGCVWVAHWGAGCISRLAPDGSLLRRVRLPASQITNVCFGGPDHSRLFVSSARAGLSPEALANEPHAGALFEVDPAGVRGLRAKRGSLRQP